jgi:hypothetical protein
VVRASGLIALGALAVFAGLWACSPLESWNQFDEGSSIKDGDSSAMGPDAAARSDVGPSDDAGPTNDTGGDGGVTASPPMYQQSFSTNSDDADAGVMSVTLSFLGAQVEGDTNVVIVGWYDKHALAGPPTDTSGNGYVLAVGPLTSPDSNDGIAQQVIYYAPNIKGAEATANTVTVSWTTTTDYYPDVTIVEFSGLDRTAPVDVTSQSSGTSDGDQGGATTSSGTATTTRFPDILLGAGTAVAGYTGNGTGFSQIVLTSDDDIVEQKPVSSAGPYAATAPLMQGGGGWVMQLVAFH